jgi:hypothetical protein
MQRRKKWYNSLVVSVMPSKLNWVFITGFACLIFSHVGVCSSPPGAGPALETSGPELVISEEIPNTVETSSANESPVTERTEMQKLIAAERQRAADFIQRLKIEDSFVARLAVKLPIVVEEVKQSVAVVRDVVKEKIKSLEIPASDVDRLPLSDLTADEGLMKRAKVTFDENTDTWLAVWKKPAVFHFGMILHPELLDQVKGGEKLHFESKGMKLALIRSDDNKLMVEQSDGKRHELGAKRLEGLLRRSISVEGLELFLDAGGNLNLKAAGQQARDLAHRLGHS